MQLLLQAKCPDEAIPLLQYFDQTYVSGTYVPRRRQSNKPGIPVVNLRRIPPKFPPELWNVHQATIVPEPTTYVKGGTTKFSHGIINN